MPGSPWWKNSRGEWYVAIQMALFALVGFGPRTHPAWPPWTFPEEKLARVVGGILLAIGGLLAGAAGFKVGAMLTPLPHPRRGAPLHESGPYRLVRHPMYSGAIFLAFGWAIWVRGWLTLCYAVLLFGFFIAKVRREERWLRKTYPGYAAYQQRVRKLIPFVY